jgi:DNA topoisomerase-2
MEKSVEAKYKKLDDIEHVLLRPGMYVGSTKPREEEVFFLSSKEEISEDKPLRAMTSRRVVYNPAFMKIFDEIISNSVDEHRRNPKLNEIRVLVDRDSGLVQVWDNGGIPVVKHTEYDQWVPELIFSNLKAGSNFDDSEDRLVAGTNGVGSTLTNIFSKEFRVRTHDGIQEFDQIFRDNMRVKEPAQVSSKKSKSGYTEISFTPDLGRFSLQEIDPDHAGMMKKRCLDLAACNPKLKISFTLRQKGSEEKEVFSFASFQSYCRMYTPPESKLFYEESGRWKVGVSPSEGSFTQVSYVNSVETKDGGSHVEYVSYQIVNWLRERLKKKHKIDLKPQEIRNHIFLFVQADIVNPAFSSQTKEKLITEVRDFGSKWEPSEKLLKEIFASEIIQRILDWAEQKALAEERKKLRELNKLVGKEKILKLIDAKATGARFRCTLALFEGDSATSAFRKYRDPMLQGAFPLRGKVLNVAEMAPVDAVKNQEIKSLLIATGLKMGEEPKDLRYGKILIYADADPDGDSITGLLVNFFGRYWPELFEEKRILRVMTPLVVAKKAGTTVPFYRNEDFEKWLSEQGPKEIKKWDIAYKKGLAALEDAEYKEIIQNPKMFAIVPGEDFRGVLDCWFAGNVKLRKEKILKQTSQNGSEA